LTSQTSHADVVVDGDFGSQGLMKRGASAGSYSIVTDNSSDWNTAYSRSVSTWTTPLQFNSGTASILQAGTSQNGYLSSTDWNTFNNKQSSLTTGNLTESITGLQFDNTRQVIGGAAALSLSTGYYIPNRWWSAQDSLSTSLATGLVKVTSGKLTTVVNTTIGTNMLTLTNPSAITFPRFNADNTVSALSASDFRTAIGAGTGSGTVTGVTATSPISSSGGTAPVISIDNNYGDTKNPYASKTANYFLAAPNGSAGVPTFRAVVAADIPTLNQNTSGSAGSVANAVTFNNAGSGDASGTTFNGSAAKTISYNTIGASASSHTHGNITNAGYLGSTANIPLITGTSGIIQAGSFGSTANTFAQGNDSRFGVTTNSVTFSNTGGAAVGTTFNGSAARTIDYSTVGAASSAHNHSGTYEPVISSGTTSQYWRGDKSWQTLNTTNVTEGTSLYFTNARARSAISLTTTGSSGASSYDNGTGILNVPNYTLAGLGGVSGSGTLNYIPKFTPNGTTLGNSQVFDNGTTVGIGTTSPAAKLNILHTNGTGGLYLSNESNLVTAGWSTTSSGAGTFKMYDNNQNAKFEWDGNVNQLRILSNYEGGYSLLNTGNFKNAGNVTVTGTALINSLTTGMVKSTNGILQNAVAGTDYIVTEVDGSITNEIQTLSVASNTTTLSNGGGSMTIIGGGINTVTTNGSNITVTGLEVDGSVTNEIELPSQAGNSGKWLTTDGTTPSWGNFSGLTGTGTANYITKWNGANSLTNSQIHDSGTTVGIGTSTPNASYKLDVNGFIVSDTIINQNTVPSLYAAQDALALQTFNYTGADATMSTQYYGFKFVPSGTYTLGDVMAQIKRSGTISNSTDYLSCYLCSNSSTVPGSILYTSTSILKFGNLGTNYTTYSFDITYTVTSGTTYWIVFKYNTAPASGSILFNTSSSSGYSATSSNGSSWSGGSNRLYLVLNGQTYHGVYANSKNNHAIYAYSSNGSGLKAFSNNYYGIWGESQNNVGIYGYSAFNHGVFGNSSNGTGVYGLSVNGSAGKFAIGQTTTSTLPVVSITQDGGSNTMSALELNQVGTGKMFDFKSNGTSKISATSTGILKVVTDATDNALEILAKTAGDELRPVTLTGLSITGNSLTNTGVRTINSVAPDASGDFDIVGSASSGISVINGTNSANISTNTVWSRMTNNTVQNSGAWTNIAFETEYNKDANVLDADYTTRIVDVKVEGDYEISFSCNSWVQAAGASGNLTIKMQVGNGNTWTDHDILIEEYLVNDGFVHHIEFDDMKHLTTAQDIKFIMFHSSGSNCKLDEVKFTVKKL